MVELREDGALRMRKSGGSAKVANRFAAAIGGGYVFASGLTALITFVGFKSGLKYSDPQTLAWMIGLVVYLIALLWGFTPRRTSSVWAVLAGGGAVMGGAAWTLSRMAA